MKEMNSIPLKNVTCTDNLWARYQRLVNDVVLPYMWEMINDRVEGAEKSWCIQNFRIAAGIEKGKHQGAVFQDTDVYKWLEAVAYSLENKSNHSLEDAADSAIDLITQAQRRDGYLDTYYIITKKKHFSDLTEGHELYTAGHLFEAAVAYFEATGKRKILDVAQKCADNLCRIFGPGEGQIHGYPGHPEVEVGLIRLYRAVGEKKYLLLADYFLKTRGQRPCYFLTEKCKTEGKYLFPDSALFGLDYYQADRPMQEQKEAEGHAVRAGYLYSALADLSSEENDKKILEQCKILWEDIVFRKMYITGGIGSAEFGERFTTAYDLPNDTCYSESCASIALAMFSNRMLRITKDSRYADIVEKALYNTVLSGISIDGKRYFYVNPLEVDPDIAEHNPGMFHVKTVRQNWFCCACCPPNIARTLENLPYYAYCYERGSLYINLFIAGSLKINEFGEVNINADYPSSGKIDVAIERSSGKKYCIALRIPGYCRAYSLCINGEDVSVTPENKNASLSMDGEDVSVTILNGYICLEKTWKSGDSVTLNLNIPFRWVYCDPRVNYNIGKCALMKGPWVYCIEQEDNNSRLASVFADTSAPIFEEDIKIGELTLPAAKFSGRKALCDRDNTQELYRSTRPSYENGTFTAIPYFAWNNRGRGEMVVWMHEFIHNSCVDSHITEADGEDRVDISQGSGDKSVVD